MVSFHRVPFIVYMIIIVIYLCFQQSSRSGNESFLTYFRFLSSHTTVRAVRHTAVPYFTHIVSSFHVSVHILQNATSSLFSEYVLSSWEESSSSDI